MDGIIILFKCCVPLFSLHLFLQLHAVPPLSGPWRLGGVAPEFLLLLLLSGPPPAATLPASPNQREQRGPKPHLLSRRLRRPGGAVQWSALYRRRRRLWGSLRPGLPVPGYQQQRPHSPADPPQGRCGGPPWCDPGPPGSQAAQHTTGQEETVGVSTLFTFKISKELWREGAVVLWYGSLLDILMMPSVYLMAVSYNIEILLDSKCFARRDLRLPPRFCY